MTEPIFETKQESKKENWAKFVLTPLERGLGITLGNSLRRVLLGGLSGAAITQVKVAGVKHQFSTLKGMREDVLDFLLNLKKVRLFYEGNKPVNLAIAVDRAGEVKAGDIETPANIKVANPDLVLATLSKGAKLSAKLVIESGVGYVSANERKSDKIGMIPLDASFSPVVKVNYKVEEARVGRLTNYDKLTLEITTDGSITPREALESASQIMVTYFNQIVNPKKRVVKKKTEDKDSLGSVGNLSVEEIGLPTRVANALIKSGFDTVERLAKAKPVDLMKVRNMGDKSLKIARVALMEKGVEPKF